MKSSEQGRPSQALRIGICCLGVSAVLSVAHAQAPEGEEGIELEEVVVTATRRETTLQDAPLAVSAITSQDIRTKGFTQYADYLNTVPGVHFEDSGPGVSDIQIRGLSSGGTTVATYFGETVTSLVNNFGGKPDLRLVDIDRVEVLRGPQGTLFGANALAGVVRIIPKEPNLADFEVDLGTRGFTTAHSDDASYHLEGVVNLPLIKDRLAVRLVGYLDDIAGYVDNIVASQPALDYTAEGEALLGLDPGTLPAGTFVAPAITGFTRRDVNSEDTWGARMGVSWAATDRLRFNFTQTMQDTKLNSEPQTHAVAGEYTQSLSGAAYHSARFVQKMDISTLRINYDWDAVSLISSSSHTTFGRDDFQDITVLALVNFGVPIPWGLYNASEGTLFTQEVRLQSRGSNPLQWMLGVFYFDQDADATQTIPDFSCPACIPELVFGQDHAGTMSGKIFDQTQKSIYGEASYDLSPQWTVGAGARWLRDEITNLTPPQSGLLVGGEVDATAVSGTATEFNPAAYLSYKPTKEMTLYLQAARGFRSGEANQPLPDNCLQEAAEVGLGPLSEPDTLWNYELGMKSALAGGRLRIATAIYKADWKGVPLPTSLDCGFNGTINAGDADAEGVEIEMEARLPRSWQINLSASYNKVEFSNVERGAGGFSAGDRVPDAPQKNASAGVQYNFAMGSEWTGFARADYSYVGDVRYVYDEPIMQDSYATGNVRLAFHREDLAVELFGRNITDKRAIVNTGDPILGGNLFLKRPRELGVEVRYSFR